MQDNLNKSSLYISLDFPHKKEENESGEIEGLYIDLDKSHTLHKERLIQRRVMVKHPDGRTTYRMQWVKASEDPKAMKKPHQQEQPKEQFHPKEHIEQPHNAPKEEPKKEEKQHTDKYNDFMNNLKNVKKPIRDKAEPKGHVNTSNLDEVPELVTYRQQADKCIKEVLPKYADMTMRMSKLAEVAQNHWKPIKGILLADNESDDSIDTFTKSVRRGMLNEPKLYPFTALGSHPAVLKHALTGIMGEENYNKAKSMLKGSNLTINTSHRHLGDILRMGYKASTPQSYLKGCGLSKEDYDKNIKIFEEACKLEDTDEIYDKLDEMSVGSSSIFERYEAEKKSMGLELEDRKPCYIAFNPGGDKLGGAPEYGDGAAVEVNKSVLNWCTIAETDTFMNPGMISRAFNEDHLQDIFMLRTLNSLDQYASGDTEEEQMKFFNPPVDMYDYDSWMTRLKQEGEIPLEVQYHKEKLEPEYLSLFRDSESEE